MDNNISLAFQITISAATLGCEFLKGNRWPHVWRLAFVTQFLWFSWIIYAGNWGLLPLTLALSFMFARNARKWRHPKGKPLTFFAATTLDGRSWKACTTCTHWRACERVETCIESRFREVGNECDH